MTPDANAPMIQLCMLAPQTKQEQHATLLESVVQWMHCLQAQLAGRLMHRLNSCNAHMDAAACAECRW